MILFLFLNYNYIQAQQSVIDGFNNSMQFASTLCHDTEFQESIRVSSFINTETLNITDKLRFTKRKYLNKHYSYINSRGFASNETSFVGHENMFDKWFIHPIKIETDELGIKTYLDPKSSLVKTDKYGITTDTRLGYTYSYKAHSKKWNLYYEIHNKLVNTIGYLYKYVFAPPNTETIKTLKDQKYTITSSKNITTAQNVSEKIIWDTELKMYAIQYYNNGKVVKTVKNYYTYYSEFNEYLLSKVESITPEVFSNGDCYELVNETFYNNYSSNCTTNIKNRSIEKQILSDTDEQLLLTPNPALDEINITIPKSEFDAILKISDLNGNILLSRKIKAKDRSCKTDISNFPAGMYIVSINQENNQISSKLVKQ